MSLPNEICIGHTRRQEYGGGHIGYEVPIHVGKPENRGNCMLIAYMGGSGATDSSKEATEEFAAKVVESFNREADSRQLQANVDSLVDQLQAAEQARDENYAWGHRLEDTSRQLYEALKVCRSFLHTHPEYQGGWMDAESAMNAADEAIRVYESCGTEGGQDGSTRDNRSQDCRD